MIDESSTSGSAVVIGAGTMGGGIAAQLANAGWAVKLLDIPSESADPSGRSAIANAGLDRVAKARPPLLFLPEFVERIETGNTSDHAQWIRDAGWVVEAVAERMDIKQAVLGLIDANAGPQTVVTSNTSGLSLHAMSAGLSASLRSRFLGSHFLNPPRYLKLLEVVPLSETDAAVSAGFVRFAEQVLGHRVVIARDTPGFISTRIWIEHLMATIHLAIEQGMSVEEADALTGALVGRPRSATFRMADLVGLDIVAAIAKNQAAALPDDPFRNELRLPPILDRLLSEGRFGDKAGGGFYRREGKSSLALDLATGEYRPREEVRIAEVDVLLKRPLAERLQTLASFGQTGWGKFVNSVLDLLQRYVEYAGPLVASDTLSVDNVMRWGFQWELGPYEIHDLRTGRQRWYRGAGIGAQMRVFGPPDMAPTPVLPEFVTLTDLKSAGKTVFETPDGALIDLGDGAACIEFRTKMNTFSPPLCDVIDRAREIAERDFAALVIGTDGPHFSAGYNLKLLLAAAESQDGESIDRMLIQVQATMLGLKYARIPVVAAVRGYTLGAGNECALHCAAIQAGPELTMGMPEMKAGLVAGGGGIKEMRARAMEGWDGRSDPFGRIGEAFKLLVLAGNSTSAEEARKLGFLRSGDSISRNADRLLFEAKRKALTLSEAGYKPPAKADILAAGAESFLRLSALIESLKASGSFTDYDVQVARVIAAILCGVEDELRSSTEERIIEQERQALCGFALQPKSIARMRALLETGKPLKN